jgi:O-succinylbenzoic acid--CoA ligase
MTRRLRAASGAAFADALRGALEGGDAVFAGVGDDIPSTVPQRIALVVQSSGSTGRPKRVALSSDAVLASAAASESALGAPGQWVLALTTTYIAGVNVLVRSIAAGTRPVAVEPGGFTAERFTAASRDLDPDVPWFTSLVPVQLARLVADEAAVDALRRFSRVLLGGQAAPTPLLERCRDLGIRVTRSYGSSETSGGCVYDGVAIGTTRVRIADGEVQIAGPVLADGYLEDPERTDAAFVLERGMRWYRTHDSGSLDDGVLSVHGRLDDVIVSGGINVSLGAVEAVTRERVPDAVVVAADDARWGQVPVVVTTASVDLADLRARVASRLGPAAAPARVLTLDVLPMLESGKPDRLSLRRRAAG